MYETVAIIPTHLLMTGKLIVLMIPSTPELMKSELETKVSANISNPNLDNILQTRIVSGKRTEHM